MAPPTPHAGGASLRSTGPRSPAISNGRAWWRRARTATDRSWLLAAYQLSAAMMAALKAQAPAPVERLRTVRLASDRGDADHKLEGPALWRRSEPGSSPELAAAMAADLAEWLDRCGAC
jgi:hypothetical protein